MRSIILSIAIVLISVPAMADDCSFTLLAITNNHASSDGVSVTLGEADNPVRPLAWLGPVTISVSGRPACTSSEDVSIVEMPVLLGRDILIVPTYSGSERRIYALDIKTCRVVWKSPTMYGGPRYQHGVLMVGDRSVRFDKACHPSAVQ